MFRQCAAAAVPLFLASRAMAADPLVERLDHAQINWTEGAVVATGSGAPKLDLDNVAQVRIAAERAAKLDAYRHVLEALEGVQVSVESTGKQRLANPRVKATVQGVLRGCKVQDTRYYSDGGVDVVLRCPFKGGLASALVPSGERTPPPTSGEKKVTGLVVDATGTAATPLLTPTVLDRAGKTVLGPKVLAEAALRTQGGVVYVSSLEEAKTHPRVGERPLVVSVGSVDARKGWTLTEEASAQLDGLDLGFLSEAAVVVVLDPKVGGGR